MLPFTFHERRLDKAMYDAIRGLRNDLEAERDAHRRDAERLRRMEAELLRRGDS
jgi:hypothetical protein